MANQQAAVTVTGFVAGDPTLGGTESFRVLTFRMGSTRSRLNPTTRQWEDYGTAWVGVKAFRALAVNAASSVRRGDRIIVVGSLITEQWTNEQGEPRSRTVLEATNIGHDLTFGTTSLSSAAYSSAARVNVSHPRPAWALAAPCSTVSTVFSSSTPCRAHSVRSVCAAQPGPSSASSSLKMLRRLGGALQPSGTEKDSPMA